MFSGIGGFHVGLEPCELVAFCEIDRKAIATYQKTFPGSTNLGDVTKVASFPKADILTAGFPCQPFSIAGKHYKSGLVPTGDSRATLYKEVLRAVAEAEPDLVLLENVPALLKLQLPNNRSMAEQIVRDLEDLGYKVWMKLLDSADFGLPTQRKRVYIVGTKSGNFSWKEPNFPRRTMLDVVGKHPIGPVETIEPSKLPKFKVEKYGPLLAYDRPIRRAAIVGDTPSGISRQRDRVYSIGALAPTLVVTNPLFVDWGSEDPKDWSGLGSTQLLEIMGFPFERYFDVPTRLIGNAVCPPVIKYLWSCYQP